MKKVRIILVALVLLICCGCVKNETIMTINDDKSVNLDLKLGYLIKSGKSIDINEAKAILNPEGFYIDSFYDNLYSGIEISKNYKNIDDISSTDDITIDFSSISDGTFKDDVLFKVEKGFFKNTYTAKYKYDLSKINPYIRKVYIVANNASDYANMQEKIKEIAKGYDIELNVELLEKSFHYINLQNLGLLDNRDRYVIYSNKIYDFDEYDTFIEDLLSTTTYADSLDSSFDSSYDLTFTVNLPNGIINSNANEVNDNKLVWVLNPFNENEINFTFEINNNSAVIIIIFTIIILIILAIIGFILYIKREADKKRFIANNTSIRSLIPKTDENNVIESVNDLMKK